jgi:hypothetical protein
MSNTERDTNIPETKSEKDVVSKIMSNFKEAADHKVPYQKKFKILNATVNSEQ